MSRTLAVDEDRRLGGGRSSASRAGGDWLVLALFACTLAACDALGIGFTPIEEIVAAPARFEGDEVKVSGEVTSVTKIPFVEATAFVLRSGGADLLVTTAGAAPAVGAKVSVRGKVENAAIVGGRSLGLRLIELERL